MNPSIKSEASTKGRRCCGVGGCSQKALKAMEGRLWKSQRGCNLRNSDQICSRRRLLGEVESVKEALQSGRTGGRETNEEMTLQSHSPPPHGGCPLPECLVSFLGPGFPSAVTMCHHAHDLCIIHSYRVTEAGHSPKLAIPMPASPSVTLHSLKWSHFSLKFSSFPSHLQGCIRCACQSFPGHATIFLVGLWALGTSHPEEDKGWVPVFFRNHLGSQ